MAFDYETCRSNLEAVLVWYGSEVTDENRNEATTRLHLIDRLLFDCFGWDREDCRVEESYGGEYADYSLYCPWRSLIVEAKREGVYFELPAGYSGIEYSVQSLCRENRHVDTAVRQAAKYCQSRGTPLAAVCNGHQLISFVASRNDGKPPLEGKAIVFVSLDKMLNNFLALWRYLSKPGVQEKHLETHSLGAYIPQLPAKLSASIPGYPGIKNRNILQTDLQIVGELVIEDVARTRELETDFIKECFCSSGALSQYALISKSILEHRYAALFTSESPGPTLVPATTRKGMNITSEIFAESLSKRPILLLGDVGVGKTMFIRYVVKVAGAEVIENAIALYVDLGTKAALSPDLRSYLLRDIEHQLLQDHGVDIFERGFVRGVYHFDLERFTRGIYSDLKDTDLSTYKTKELQFLEERIKNIASHLKQCLVHLSRGRKKQIVLLLDNADQRDENTQEQAFLIAQEIAANWPVTVFLTIRPQTFHRSKKIGALTGYHPKAFTISPPRVDEVIRKRLDFALKVAQGDLVLGSLPTGVSVKFESLKTYLNVLKYSFGVNQELIEFIDNLCGGNIRLALEFLTTFIGSGHVDTQKILDIEAMEAGRRHYRIPLHEFLRAVIFGDNEHFDPRSSPVANVFDIATPDEREHFLLPILVEYIHRAESFADSEGFVDAANIYEYAQRAGFTPAQINGSLLRALRKNLLEAEGRDVPQNGQTPRLFRVTTIGSYHIARLIRQFAYVDAIVVDTPVLDGVVRKRIHNTEMIEDRLRRATIFRNYLDDQWEKLNRQFLGFNWTEVSHDLGRDIERIREKIS